MSIHEISDIIHKYSDDTVKVVNIRIGLICTVCGHEWGIKVDDEQELIRQASHFLCMPCYQRKIEEKNIGNIVYGKSSSNED